MCYHFMPGQRFHWLHDERGVYGSRNYLQEGRVEGRQGAQE